MSRFSVGDAVYNKLFPTAGYWIIIDVHPNGYYVVDYNGTRYRTLFHSEYVHYFKVSEWDS